MDMAGHRRNGWSSLLDYQTWVETYGWLVQLHRIQDGIAREAIKKESLVNAGYAVDASASRTRV